MTTLAEATAAPVPVAVNGKTHLVSPLTNRDYGELERWIQIRIIQLARESIEENTPDDLRAATMDAAVREATSTQWFSPRGVAATRTEEGTAVYMWLSLRKKQPTLTLAQTKDLIEDRAARAALLDAFNLVNGFSAKKKTVDPDQADVAGASGAGLTTTGATSGS